jgi:hypothetical protein
MEELGIKIESPELIAINEINQRKCFAFFAKTNLKMNEVKIKWNFALDKAEHSELIFIPEDKLKQEVISRSKSFNSHSLMGSFSYLYNQGLMSKDEFSKITDGDFIC